MTAERTDGTEMQRAPARWKPWLQILAAAAALLVLSEAIWLWQTWPVRELLQPASGVRAESP